MLIRLRSDANLPNGIFSDYQGASASFQMDPRAFNVDPATISHFGSGVGGQPNTAGNWSGLGGLLSSAQSDIVNNRSNVSQQFGQITPPDDNTASVFQNQSAAKAPQQSQEEITKLNRAQRARNAANKRHSKTKKRKDSPMNEAKAEEGEEDDQSTATTVQREKNRIAARRKRPIPRRCRTSTAMGLECTPTFSVRYESWETRRHFFATPYCATSRVHASASRSTDST